MGRVAALIETFVPSWLAGAGCLAGWGWLVGWLAGWAGWLAGLAGLVIPGLSLEGFSALELLGSRRPGTQGLPKRGSDMEGIAKIDF